MAESKHYGFHILRYGAHVHELVFCIFHNDWMDCRDAFHAVLCLYYCVIGQNIAEYEEMSILIISPWGALPILSFEAVCVNKPTIIIMFSKSKQARYKGKIVILRQ